MSNIDYKKELESASRSMIMIHDPHLLIKLIMRMIVRKFRVRHAGMILFDPDKNSFVLNISRGEAGLKVPAGFTRFSYESPVIKIFYRQEFRSLTLSRNAIVSDDINRLIWKESLIENKNGFGPETKELLHQVEEQMQMLNTIACVPAFYQKQLMAVLLLGEKADNSKYDQDELDFFAALASDAAMAIRNAQLFGSLKHEAERSHKLFLQTIIVLGSTIEAKDAYTHGHTERVTQHAMSIARQMVVNGSAKFEESFFENLYISGLLHDIGKIAIPENILNKNGKLTPEEFEIMKQHAARGADIVQPLGLPKETVDGIKHHHEAFDGSGYPDGLKGAEIPISAAVLAVADTFDAMTTDRPYRKGLPRETALDEIKRKSGIQFNPIPVKAFIELSRAGKV